TFETDYSKFKNVIIDKYNFNKLIGESQEIQKVYNSIEKIIDTNINVSLHGEPGTGKEMVAKVIHYNSERKLMPFISIDLRAIKYDARDVELLGVDNSVRDDKNNQIGFLERANGGTIFIEGFEDINERFQFYLQKILQNKEIIRVGGIESIPLDVRIITSYNHSLSELVKQEKVKELQYFRTMGAPIEIPPLRQRGNDIIILAKKFINNFTTSNNMAVVTLNLDAQDKLINHPYTGNVQELKAVIELATVMCNNNTITEDDIKFNSTKGISDFLLDEKTLKDYTRGIIKHFLTKYDDNVLLVAEKLDVGKSTIYRMLKNHEI
ncbi:MAG: sigma-54-dependent Fis family transcriptional regulator, partial [Flavobacteriales bacterium]|nr:sigma-54-dependent Fis family transcriptional regulator [Flavobacteriales bacterium]